MAITIPGDRRDEYDMCCFNGVNVCGLTSDECDTYWDDRTT